MTRFLRMLAPPLLLSVLLAGSGCFSVYEPPPISAPLLGKRNDVAVAAGLQADQKAVGMHGYGELAWAPSDHSRVVVSAAHLAGKQSEGAHGEHTQGLLAAGWGMTFVPAVRIEALGGGGYDRFAVSECDFGVDGRAETCDDWMDGKGRSGRVFAQVHVGAVTAPLEVLAGLRTTVMFVAFDEFRVRPDWPPDASEVPFTTRRLTVPIAEPFVAVRGGYKWIKAELQLTLPFVIDSPEVDRLPLVRNAGPRLLFGLRASYQDIWKYGLREVFRKEPQAP